VGEQVSHRIFEAAVRHDLRVALHAWGRAGNASTPSGFTSTYLEDYVGNQPIAQAQILSLVCEGVFDRFPELHVLLTECGFAWLPPLLWRFDKDWRGVWREVPWVSEKPSAYVHRHFRATTAPAHLPDDATAVAELAQMLDAGTFLLFASEYPHAHGDGMESLLGVLDDGDREAVLLGNALSFYGLG
jgi:predicted TIM-barrel fold metal-dependent hydrolase